MYNTLDHEYLEEYLLDKDPAPCSHFKVLHHPSPHLLRVSKTFLTIEFIFPLSKYIHSNVDYFVSPISWTVLKWVKAGFWRQPS